MGARFHDQCLGALRIDAGQFQQVVDREVGKVIAGFHPGGISLRHQIQIFMIAGEPVRSSTIFIIPHSLTYDLEIPGYRDHL